MYFFGVREPDFYGAINVNTGETTLFIPRLPNEYATWLGRLSSCDDFASRYGVDVVRYIDEVSATPPFQDSLLILIIPIFIPNSIDWCILCGKTTISIIVAGK